MTLNLRKKICKMINKPFCAYCGVDLSNVISKEHIIQNALGGLYESKTICCPDCNNRISEIIDKPFVDIFAPIISNIHNLRKTHNVNSKPLYSGVGIYDNKEYLIYLKGNKVVSCPELCKKLKCDVSKIKFTNIYYNFNIDDKAFKQGIKKIAFNFAVEKQIPISLLKEKVKIKTIDNNIEEIVFDYKIMPFLPLNPIDEQIELNSNFELYHNLILFNEKNLLWCYVDLFNTFQYYVLLSENWRPDNIIYESYLQLLQAPDRIYPKFEKYNIKELYSLLSIYNIDIQGENSIDKVKQKIYEKIRKKSSVIKMEDFISKKLNENNKLLEKEDIEFSKRLIAYTNNLQLYFDENDILNECVFRKLTIDENTNKVAFYPELIYKIICKNCNKIKLYTHTKFYRLTKFILN